MMRHSMMQRATRNPRLVGLCLGAVLFVGCRGDRQPDAYGNFEATEVVVSGQVGGQLLSFTPVEGGRLAAGAVVGLIDSTQLALERRQIVAQREATGARASEVGEQIDVLTVQRSIAQRTYERTRRLFDAHAATAQQLDQAERDYRVLGAQIEAARAQRQSVTKDVAASTARVAQINERLTKSQVVNPHAGTVLTTYVRAGEVVQAGQPLYKIADLDTLILRAYVTEPQLAAVKLGQRVDVHVDQNGGTLRTVPGTVSWIASKAEFTPTPVQTRDERADLVYAIKVRVLNANGALKIGMPADVAIPSQTAARTP